MFFKNIKLLQRRQDGAEKPIKSQTAGQANANQKSKSWHKIKGLFIKGRG